MTTKSLRIRESTALSRIATGAIAVLALALSSCSGAEVPESNLDSTSNGEEIVDSAEAPDEGAPLTDVKFRLSWTLTGYQAPFFAAKALGYYEEDGLNVEIGFGKGTDTTLQLLTKNQDDIGFLQLCTMADAIAKHDLPLKAVASVFQRMPDVVFVRKSAGISAPSELAGAEIVASADRPFFPVFAKNAGFDPTDVSFLTVDSKLSAFVNGQGDAFLTYDSDAPALAKAGVDVDVFRYSDEGVNCLSQGLATSHRMLEENPGVVEAFVHATMRGIAYTIGDPEGAIDLMHELNPEDVPNREQRLDELTMTLENLFVSDKAAENPLGFMPPAQWEASQDLLEEVLGTPHVDVEEFYTNELVLNSPVPYEATN